MILQKLDNFHESFGHNKSGGLWVSTTVLRPKDTIWSQTRDVAGYESGLS